MNTRAPQMVTPKPWYESKSVWFNALTIASVVLVFLIQQQDAGLLPFVIDAKWIVFGQGAINLILRFVSGAPIVSK